jgi:hypothetical protein
MRDRPTFELILSRWSWQPIPNCPGRFRLTGESSRSTPPSVIVGISLPSFEFRVDGASDPVIVTPLGNGTGLISYRRESGEYVHTLNTPEGFGRKLEQLGIKMPAESD